MSSIDLRDVYYSIPIEPGHRKYLKFSRRGVLYQFTVLPMGLTSSPRIFTKVLKPFLPRYDQSLVFPAWAILTTLYTQKLPMPIAKKLR